MLTLQRRGVSIGKGELATPMAEGTSSVRKKCHILFSSKLRRLNGPYVQFECIKVGSAVAIPRLSSACHSGYKILRYFATLLFVFFIRFDDIG